VISDDPTDNIFFECAIDSNADYIISGDKHILDFGKYKNIQIVKPKDFLLKEGFLQDT
jgi:predicted nucleic acid-binding protein